MNKLKLLLMCFCIIFLVLVFATPVHAQLVLGEGAPTGQWYNPDRDGEGFYVEIIDTGGILQISVAMYSYDDQGNQLWLIGNVEISETATTAAVPVFLVEGPVWGAGYDKDDRIIQDFGTITVRFTTCNSATFQIQTNSQVTNLPSGTYALVRLTDIRGIECTDSPPAPPPEPPPDPEGGVTPGLWTGPGGCFFVNEEGNRIIESDACDEGKALSLEAPGFEVDIDGDWEEDSCQANVVCGGAWNIYFETDYAGAECVNESGSTANVYFSSPTTANVEGWQELEGDFRWCVGFFDATPTN